MASSRSDQFPLTSWLIQYVEESSETNFIDLTEIKSKFQSDVLVEENSANFIRLLNEILLPYRDCSNIRNFCFREPDLAPYYSYRP
jgi:hypothetical protein